MSLELWLGVIVAALGTYLLRLLPLLWMQRHLKRRDGEAEVDALPKWLVVLGPMMIAAVLGVSLVPRTSDPEGWLATVVGLGVTLVVWRKTRSLGWPVVGGVLTFGAVVIVARVII
ncbi:AzlD domain-containing protein [Salinicola acroporae]|uniref:Branched-chain amino acid ABC transporter n=1 Tax=Salinicola acroporae TaxID=1541440 RepID=A0ABT6I9L4_9GAMM|nr:AzlD domain-containing protein [Salinicola acroporae]MDH4573785.1 branched-chain amino acid ABC transporter [Salinicola acroporae]